MPVNQYVQIDTYDYGASLAPVTFHDLVTDALIAGGTAASCAELSVDSGTYRAVFTGALPANLIPAGTYRIRSAVSGSPLKRFVTLTGVDGEVAYARIDRHAELDSAARVKLAAVQPDLSLATAAQATAIQADVTTLLGRITAAVYTMFVDLIAMITGSGTADAKFDAVALSNGLSTESDLMLSTTIASVTSQTVLVLTAGSPDNDAYKVGQIVVFTDAVTSTQKARSLVSSYVGLTKTLTLSAAPLFVVAAGDNVTILAVGSTVISSEIATAISAAVVSAGIDTTVTGMPTFLRVGDARTVANGGAIAVRLYSVGSGTILLGLGTRLFINATSIKFSLRRASVDGTTEGVEDVAIACTWVESGADGYVRIAYAGNALNAVEAMDRLKEKDCHRWGIKFQWGTDDPVTPVYGTISILSEIAETQ